LDAPPVTEIATRIIEDAERNDRRDRTISELKSRLATFSDDLPDRRLAGITVEELEEWLDQEDWSPRSRINYLTKISRLYNYTLRHRCVNANIEDRIERPAVEDKEPGVFTVTEAKQLLKNAAKFGLLPYTAVGFFAGLRAAELLRLEWRAANVAEKSIVVGAQVAKKTSRRDRSGFPGFVD
jgi:integrase